MSSKHSSKPSYLERCASLDVTITSIDSEAQSCVGRVESASGGGAYIVHFNLRDDTTSCTCPGSRVTGMCKHIAALMLEARKEMQKRVS